MHNKTKTKSYNVNIQFISVTDRRQTDSV